jgi:hypothetical protein
MGGIGDITETPNENRWAQLRFAIPLYVSSFPVTPRLYNLMFANTGLDIKLHDDR